MENILVIGCFIALLLGLLLFIKKNHKLHDRFLACYFLLLGINILLMYLEVWNKKNNYAYPWIFNLNAPWMLLHGPLLWLYVKSNITPRFKFRRVYLLHAIPFLLVFIEHTIKFYSVPAEQKIYLAKSEAFKQDLTFPVIVSMITISILSYFAYNYRLLKKYEKAILNSFSTIDGIDLTWLKNLIGSALLVYLLVMAIIVSDLFLHYIPFKTFEFIAFSVASLFMIFLGIYGLSRTNVFTSDEKYARGFTDPGPLALDQDSSSDNGFVEKLEAYMKNNKPYTDFDITIGKLAEIMNVKVEYLSEVLNSRLNQNFFDYINTYRINEFKERVKDKNTQNLTLMGIAYDCGFNSKATFNRVFKRKEKYTPGEYKKRIDSSL